MIVEHGGEPLVVTGCTELKLLQSGLGDNSYRANSNKHLVFVVCAWRIVLLGTQEDQLHACLRHLCACLKLGPQCPLKKPGDDDPVFQGSTRRATRHTQVNSGTSEAAFGQSQSLR